MDGIILKTLFDKILYRLKGQFKVYGEHTYGTVIITDPHVEGIDNIMVGEDNVSVWLTTRDNNNIKGFIHRYVR